MAAGDRAHRDRIETLDRAIDNLGFDRTDMIRFDPEAAAVCNQRQHSVIEVEQPRPIIRNYLEQRVETVCFHQCDDRSVNGRGRSRMAASEGDQVFLALCRGQAGRGAWQPRALRRK